MSEPFLTLLMSTARPDYPLVGLPDTFIFEPTVQSLNNQEAQNFELVVVDACWSEKRQQYLEKEAKFPVQYINPYPNRYLQHGLWATSSMKNKGITAADGALVMFIDDGTELVLPHWTKSIEELFRKGYWPMSLTAYHKGGEPMVLDKNDPDISSEIYSKLSTFTDPGQWVMDSRWRTARDETTMIAPWEWFYSGSSATKAALIEIHGRNEALDGCRGLSDTEAGYRLHRAGYSDRFLLNRLLYHVDHWDNPIQDSNEVLWNTPVKKCNYGILLYIQKTGAAANTSPLTRETCNWIREKLCPTCPHQDTCVDEELGAQFFIDNEQFETWLELQQMAEEI